MSEDDRVIKPAAWRNAATSGEDLRAEGDTPNLDGMTGERIARLEGANDGVKQSQTILIGSVFGLSGLFFALAAILVTLQLDIRSDVKKLSDDIKKVSEEVSSNSERVSETLRSEFRSMRAEQSAQTSAIANAITATKQQAPQVILVPAPQAQQPASPQQ